jgi:hypothetical protein
MVSGGLRNGSSFGPVLDPFSEGSRNGSISGVSGGLDPGSGTRDGVWIPGVLVLRG